MDELAQTREALSELVDAAQTVYQEAQVAVELLPRPLGLAIIALHDLAVDTTESYGLES